MYGNFTRDSYRRRDHFTSVRLQQGALVTDADVNEAADIAAHRMRTLAADLIGPHGGPRDACAFALAANGPRDFAIGAGHYYVDGVLCEVDAGVTYRTQPGLPDPQPLVEDDYLVYLHVFERHVTAIERPQIRDVALGDADTSHRTELVWQLKTRPVTMPEGAVDEQWAADVLAKLTGRNRPQLRARVRPEQVAADPCVISPESRYRGVENQLYRVEVHDGGLLGEATFVFSRDNGSVVFGIVDVESMTLANLGHDDRFSLHEGDRVEVVDDTLVLADLDDRGRGEIRPLCTVEEVDRDRSRVVLSGAPAGEELVRPFLRRWDRARNDAGVTESPAPVEEGRWIELESGIEVYFEDRGAIYRPGDYWLIPARVASGEVIWPGPPDDPAALAPRGPRHHYAPIARLRVSNGGVTDITDFRRRFAPLGTWP